MQTKPQPKIYPITALPDFVKSAAGRIWEENGTPKDISQVVYTFYDGIYTASPMAQDLFVHECVHYVRQGAGENKQLAMEWIERYVVDKDFRYEEELLAYREQYLFILKNTNKQVAFEHAKRLAKDLSGPLYGNLKPYFECLNAIIKQ